MVQEITEKKHTTTPAKTSPHQTETESTEQQIWNTEQTETRKYTAKSWIRSDRYKRHSWWT